MADFSNLIKFKNDLSERVSELSLTSEISERIRLLITIQNRNLDIPIAGVFDQYIQEYKELDSRNRIIIESLNSEILALTQRIDDIAKELFDTDSNRNLFNESKIYQSMTVNEKEFEIINTQIGSYSNWRYPSLILYPRDKKWISSSIVASDPLYIVHDNSILGNDYDSVLTLMEDFSDVYKSRLRVYSIDSNNYSILPQNQFGFILLWDWLTYLSIDRFNEYFQQIYKLLKPGGSCMFSYNNCDIPESARLAELNDASYATAKKVKQLVKRIGFNILKVVDLPTDDAVYTHISWIEIQKPGKLTTVKAHQALARIIPK
jgi:SAM-dependent methyltransferase